MNKYTSLRNPYVSNQVGFTKWGLYAFVLLGLNVAIWGLTLTYLRSAAKTYTSNWSMVLPGAGAASAIDIEGIGTSSSNANSAYANGSDLDPRANYKAIAESDEVLKVAANSLNMTIEEFGEPKIKLVEPTALLEFSSTGSSPKEAQQKNNALYKALEQRISELRTGEAKQRTQAAQETIRAAQAKMDSEQKRLSAYKLSSGLVSTDQVPNLLLTIEELRKQYAIAISNRQDASNRLVQLSNDLGLSAKQASDSFLLQSDQIFQQNLKNYSDASTDLVVLSAKWQPNHPAVLAAGDKQQATREALLRRGQELLGRPINETILQRLGPSGATGDTSPGRETLYQDLVTVQAEYQGLTGQVEELAQQMAQLEAQIKKLAQQEPALEDLQRSLKTSEAVFSSTLAKVDIGRSDIFASYPLIQAIGEPSLPEKPSSPKKSLTLLGAAMASLFLTTGIILVGIYQGRKRRSMLHPQEEVDPAEYAVPQGEPYFPRSKAEQLILNNQDALNHQQVRDLQEKKTTP